MSGFDFDDIVLDGTAGSSPVHPVQHSVPQPVAQPAPGPIQPTVLQYQPKVGRAGVHPAWAALLAFLAVTFACLWLSAIWPSVGPNPDVDPVDGAYVAIFYDDEEKGDYTADQITAMDSAVVAEFLDETVSGWKKIDVDQLDELKNLKPVYAEMADVHRAKLPWVVVRSGRKLGSEPVTTPDDLIELVNRTAK